MKRDVDFELLEKATVESTDWRWLMKKNPTVANYFDKDGGGDDDDDNDDDDNDDDVYDDDNNDGDDNWEYRMEMTNGEKSDRR